MEGKKTKSSVNIPRENTDGLIAQDVVEGGGEAPISVLEHILGVAKLI